VNERLSPGHNRESLSFSLETYNEHRLFNEVSLSYLLFLCQRVARLYCRNPGANGAAHLSDHPSLTRGATALPV
jgi:hypothetical protein